MMEDRIKKLELLVRRLLRKERKKVQAIITPYPISNAVLGDDIKGHILRYMFPCEGTIIKGLIDVGKRLKEGALVEVRLGGEVLVNSKSYTMNGRKFLLSPELKTCSGDKLTISIKPVGKEIITEVWISFLWVPTMKDVEVKKFLIDSIEEDLLDSGDAA